jgi:diamine N-acetyltransferase
MMTIRSVRLDEADRLGAFLRDIFVVTYGLCSSPENVADFLEHNFCAATLSTHLRDPQLRILVLTEGDVWAGVAQLRLPIAPDTVAYLSRFFFDARFHGRGHAQRLLAHVVDCARAGGARHLQLSAWEHAPQAIRFYQKCGFTHIGSVEFIIGSDVLEDWLMQLPL